MALLDVVPEYVVDDGETGVNWHTFPWYNGREKGVAVRMGMNDRVLTVTFGECRGTDDIFVDSWESDQSWRAYEPATVAEFPDEAYAARHTTRNPQAAADKVLAKMRAFYKAQKKEQKRKRAGKAA
jgi:hypothetical protein